MRKILLFVFLIMTITPSFATTPDISPSTTTTSCADAILNTNGGVANIEINWEPNTIPIHWYDENTELTVPTESQSCVYDGALTPPPPPEKEGYTFRGWRVRGLPDTYTRLQYIESNENQWIDTEITASTRAVFTMSATAATNEVVLFIISNTNTTDFLSGFGLYHSSVAGSHNTNMTNKHTYDITYSSSGISVIYDGEEQFTLSSYYIYNNQDIVLFGGPSTYRRIRAKL